MLKTKEDREKDEQMDDGAIDESRILSDGDAPTQQGQTRRGVLKILGVALGGALNCKLASNLEGEKQKLNNLVREAKVLFEKVGNENKREYMRTIVLALLAQMGEIILLMVYQKVGMDLSKMGGGNQKSLAEFEEKSPKIYALFANVIAPVFEEIIFRELPYRHFIKKIKEGDHWSVGIASSAVFALVHNITNTDKFPFLGIEGAIPLPQFAGGILFWHLRVNKGLDHAILAHMVQNASQGKIIELLEWVYPPRDESDDTKIDESV